MCTMTMTLITILLSAIIRLVQKLIHVHVAQQIIWPLQFKASPLQGGRLW